MNKPWHFNTHRKMDLIILLLLICIVVTYFWDAYSASTEVRNLILIMPITLLVLALCAIEFVRQVVKPDAEPSQLEPVSSVLPVISLFTVFVLTLPWLGFDVGTFFFVLAFLWLHGERRVPWALGYALVFAILIAWFFSLMLPYPMPMLVLPTDY